ncbi:MAG: hypothetical protein IJE21_07235 [Alistipes sp.]|nr:hypothetical protein [Alistipes sp.]
MAEFKILKYGVIFSSIAFFTCYIIIGIIWEKNIHSKRAENIMKLSLAGVYVFGVVVISTLLYGLFFNII